MELGAFTHLLFWKSPIASLCFFALGMSFISLWVRKTAWLWGSFLLIATILAFDAKIATWLSLIPILILFLCHFFLQKEISQKTRFLLFGTAVAISLAMLFHFLPGFHNWNLVKDATLSPGAYPYSFWLNFDSPFIGIFALGLSIPLIASRAQLFKILKISIPLSLLGIFLMMGISLYFGLVKWDPKIPVFTIVWLIANLIFVSIPEEAFFRGFVQREFYSWFGKTPLAAMASIFVTSLMFTLLHLPWVASIPFLCLVFIASLIYGAIYQITQSVEASILCHFGLNITHFFFFTYPAIQA
jgi:uncharacterized protein